MNRDKWLNIQSQALCFLVAIAVRFFARKHHLGAEELWIFYGMIIHKMIVIKAIFGIATMGFIGADLDLSRNSVVKSCAVALTPSTCI